MKAVAALLAALAPTLAGCAETTTRSTADKTVTVTAPQTTSSSTSTAKSTPAPPPEPETAGVGDSLTLGGANDLTVRVTLTAIDELPVGEFDAVDPGTRVVGVRLRLTNTSDATYDDAPSNGAALIDDNEEQAESAGFVGDCTAAIAKIAPGDSRRICLPFALKEGAQPVKFQFALDSGFSDENGEWEIEASSASTGGESSGGGDASSSASGGASAPLTSCDQNIRIGAKTTCGFANNVFREYARILQSGDDSSEITLDAKSPATGTSYSVTCTEKATLVQCRAGDGGYVRFPLRAAEVY